MKIYLSYGAFDDKVKIEYFGANKGVIITDLVLPTLPPKKEINEM